MLKTIYSIIENFGLSVQKRALHIYFSNEVLNPQVFIQRIDGEHRINQGLSANLLCLSTNAHIPLKQFIGSRVAIDQVTDFGQLYRTTGIITAASQGQSDGALTVYQLTLEDATALWHKRRNSRVFMNKSVRDITEILFSEWQQKSALFASSLSLNLEGLSREYAVRPFSMQANESDYEFLTRLWRSEGMNWLIDEKELTVPVSVSPIQAQVLRLIDHNQVFEVLARQSIRFHRSHATERMDTITSFVAQRFLQSTAVQTQRWQAQSLAQDQSNPLLSTHAYSEQHDNEMLSLEQVWTLSSAWTSDLNGEDQATQSGPAQLEQANLQLNQYQALTAKYFIAHSSVRDAQVGYWFRLTDHPEINQHEGSDCEFLILGKKFYNQNNLPKDIEIQLESLLIRSRWQALIEERQANELYVVRRTIAVVPEYDPLQHRPMAYPQRAKVVGPEGESIHVDAWGRIKVRFNFTRTDDHSHDGGAGSNDNDTDSAWVDVLTPWAGEGYGARFHPRIGEIVVIDFFEGDVDRPFVVGRIHEAERHQTMFDVKGQLPDTKKLSGIRSQEVGGSGFNQLRFDDTTGQISTQLQSSHAATQLNLGNLSHPKDKEQSYGRGEGFELRTDAFGAVRAGRGMLISTYAQENAIADHLEATKAQALLSQGQESMKMLSSIAVKQQTDALNVIGRLPKLIQSLEIKSTSDAVITTLSLFKDNLVQDPLSALKNCKGFIQDIGAITKDVQGTVKQFKAYFDDAEDAFDNLKEVIQNLEDHGTDQLQDRVKNLRSQLKNDPLKVLKEVGKIVEDIKINPDEMIIGGGFGKPEIFMPTQALEHVKGFMESYSQNIESSSDPEQQEQGKLFRQALMLLASPNGIAMTTPEDIVLQASQDIALSAQGSVNISAQKNIVSHAQDKISLFAAQRGLSAYAAKGKLELQAQDDALEAIARKVIKLISTEDKIEITSPKEIVLTAGGSQLKINGSGIFTTTGGKFESKAGQHSFVGGETINAQLPKLAKNGIFSRRFDFKDLISQELLENGFKYKVINKDKNTEFIGMLDKDARTQRIFSDNPDNIEIRLLGKSEIDSDKLVLIEENISQDKLDHLNEACCGGHDDEHKHDAEEIDDNSLEADFKSFGI
ncbi:MULTISPECIES: type VI secretion system Vgr family protein [Acinetobacter]|jgi:type VI secretion system secreted protein VgrG|uniref:Type VI secretion system tip protein VgrG n=1 Tax=Acinetobacter chengduensis TaxID=2420890 RepID=A0ABX9TWQ1_9GAMM|nr:MULTISPECIES: type VI secretion system Vgr family protein [Acinetobacter]MBI1452664.1 type VI secretion system tip protein VgrG [Acinetobacter sp. FL51]RKG39149.1 type VI secretion system tip protein VgrG [Acinetobacter sp. WCHAc060007]RLL21851.1 type VI secretion system tip protein VgrG [Acinetobacter chengduensis]